VHKIRMGGTGRLGSHHDTDHGLKDAGALPRQQFHNGTRQRTVPNLRRSGLGGELMMRLRPLLYAINVKSIACGGVIVLVVSMLGCVAPILVVLLAGVLSRTGFLASRLADRSVSNP
jgi:hypothetical protein